MLIFPPQKRPVFTLF